MADHITTGALDELAEEAAACMRCSELVATRTRVVFGVGNASADLMLIGEAPGAREDEQGSPFVGASGRVLDELLASIELDRSDIYVTNVLLCRPPLNRDPKPEEIRACESFLFRQARIVQPRVVGTLGSFATKLLSGTAKGISRIHGQEHEMRIGGRLALLYPLFHPALALHNPPMRPVIFRDFARVPELLERELVDNDAAEADAHAAGEAEDVEQLGLFTTGRFADVA